MKAKENLSKKEKTGKNKGIQCQRIPSVIGKASTAGITLVALVVTVIILLILAGVTITYVLGDRGIIQITKDARSQTDASVENEQKDIGDLADWLKEEREEAEKYRIPKVADNLGKVISETENTVLEDVYGNPITVPAGFKIVTPEQDNTVDYNYSDDGTPCVQDGIVIADSEGNQFVWIPVGTIKNKEGDTEHGDTTTIELARYTFNIGTYHGYPNNTYDGTGEIEQTKTDGGTLIKSIGSAYEFIEENANSTSTYENAKAKNIEEFISKTNANGGYYLARYEASYGSGYNSSGSTDDEKYGNAKPLSKPSTANDYYTMSYTAGTLWNNITQPNAAKVAQNMYKENKDVKGNTVGVESDLVNSYAWDTAIVFIQAYSGENSYSKQPAKNEESLANTGENNDKVCNIHDMASNCAEWSTETGTYSVFPCTDGGGSWSYGYGFASCRGNPSPNDSSSNVSYSNGRNSFRVILYVQ